MPPKTRKIEPRTIQFSKEMERMELAGTLPTTQELAKIMKLKSKSSISEIRYHRQNIQPAQWKRFIEYFKIKDHSPVADPVQEQLATIIRNQQMIMKKLGITNSTKK